MTARKTRPNEYSCPYCEWTCPITPANLSKAMRHEREHELNPGVSGEGDS